MLAKLKALVAKLKALGSAIENWRWTARSTVFAIFFAITAFYLVMIGKMTGREYVFMASTLHVSVVTRAIFEGKEGGNNDDDDPDASGGDRADAAS